MSQPQTFLHCSRRTAALVLCAIFSLFLLIGCAAMLRKTGLDQTEADRLAAIAEQNLADAATEAVQNIKEGLAQGKTPQTIAIETGSAFAWKLATIGASTIGAVLSGLLAKWLGTEKKINKVLITSIEKTSNKTTKAQVHKKATKAGIESQLNRRVQALT